MAKTFFFYDLETSGLNGREARVMQFAGIRTDMELNQIGKPYDILVRLDDDTLPSPDALMVTGITPQQTREEGVSEAEFCRVLSDDIFTADTTVVGFNNIRFDDEFIRHTLWRNFYDPYEWAWKNGRSRWDLLDVVRITRALRPEGIEWPVDDKGKATNRLELLAKVNKLEHTKAHDALSDVEALIGLTKLIRGTQPKLYHYLLDMRDKKRVKQLVNLDDKQPFVYTSGRYDTNYEKTTVAFPLTAGKNGNVVVYDLRHDPAPFIDLTPKELAKKLYAPWDERKADGFVALPVKELQYNRVPAVAPLGVLEQAEGWKKIDLTPEKLEAHKKTLLSSPSFAENIRTLFENKPEYKKSADPEAQLYDGFVGDKDKLRIETVRNASSRELADFHPTFQDERLDPLLVHYKGRNFPESLSEDESVAWETWRAQHLAEQLPLFASSLERLGRTTTDEDRLFVLQEAQLWAESIIPNEPT